MNILSLFLANKTVTVGLLVWAVTAGWSWYSNMEERLQYEQAMEQYQEAYMDAQEDYEQLDTATKQATLLRREIHAKASTALEGLNSVARQEVRKKMGSSCGPYAQRIVPRYYVDILRLAAQQAPSRSEAKEQSTTKRAVTRLRAAFTRQGDADSGGVRKEPVNKP